MMSTGGLPQPDVSACTSERLGGGESYDAETATSSATSFRVALGICSDNRQFVRM